MLLTLMAGRHYTVPPLAIIIPWPDSLLKMEHAYLRQPSVIVKPLLINARNWMKVTFNAPSICVEYRLDNGVPIGQTFIYSNTLTYSLGLSS